jgi:hypothetical protein
MSPIAKFAQLGVATLLTLAATLLTLVANDPSLIA